MGELMETSYGGSAPARGLGGPPLARGLRLPVRLCVPWGGRGVGGEPLQVWRLQARQPVPELHGQVPAVQASGAWPVGMGAAPHVPVFLILVVFSDSVRATPTRTNVEVLAVG